MIKRVPYHKISRDTIIPTCGFAGQNSGMGRHRGILTFLKHINNLYDRKINLYNNLKCYKYYYDINFIKHTPNHQI